MEVKVDDLTIGYQKTIDFSTLQNDSFIHASTFQAMATPDGSSYVIIYQWVDPKTMTFNDREEAFYIDDINEANKGKAREIFESVYSELQSAFQEDKNQKYDLEELVNSIVNENKKSRAVM